MIYELRIYQIHPGRMEDACNRFRDYTLKIFQKHGIKVVNLWINAEGKDIIYYVCEFENLGAKTAAWDSFRSDPDWIKVKAESEANGPIVMTIDSSIIKTAGFFH